MPVPMHLDLIDKCLFVTIQVAARITSPIVTTYIDTDKISFERSKSGIWGWRSDKTESINAYECKVSIASQLPTPIYQPYISPYLNSSKVSFYASYGIVPLL